MINFILVSIFIFLAAAYALSLYVEKKQIARVEAGPVAEAKTESYDTVRFSFFDTFNLNGKAINPSFYTKLFVEGSCMQKRNIYDRDIVFARKFSKSFDKSQIKPNDILLIWLNDERYKGYKIRVFKDYNPENKAELITFYYNEDGSEHFSSHHHKLDDVKGVVKYKKE